MRIYIAIIDHGEGRDVYAHLTAEQRTQEVYGYVREWWEHEGLEGPIPDDQEQAIREYFEWWVRSGMSNIESLETLALELEEEEKDD